MDNIITYAEQTLDTFAVRPFCDVDSLILSCVAYLDLPEELSDAHSWKGLSLRDLFRAEHFDRLFSVTFAPERTKKLLTAIQTVLANPGYREAADRISESFRRCSGAPGAADKIQSVCSARLR